MIITETTMMLRILFLVLVLKDLSSYAAAAAVELESYVVHMDKTKVKASSDVSLGTSKRWYEAIIESIAGEDDVVQPTSPPELLYVYEDVISGFSAKLSKQHVESLKRVDGFLSATKDELLALHTTHSPDFLGLQQGKGLWDAQNLASDVIIGVVDTGIWPEHPSFSGSGIPPVPPHWKGKCKRGPKFAASNCNKKLIGARAFFKGYEAIAGRINETSDYRSPRDSQGHGTHTASTAGGNLVRGASLFGLGKGSAAGMKYTARIAAYKACYQLGCASSDILASVERAVKDGVDVLSLSLGGASKPYYNDNIAIAAFGAMQKGVIVSCSAGNSGPTDSSISNIAPWMITVAASYTDRGFPTKVMLGDGRIFSGASLYTGKPTKQLPLVNGENAGGAGAKYCTSNSLSPSLVKGKMVICDRGITSRAAKGEEVKSAGGAGMILANSVNQGEELFADPHVLPATSLGAVASRAVKIYSNTSTTATAMITFEGTVYNNRAPVMAAFSSRGPSQVVPQIIKPDLTAPGVNILAAWPPNISPTELKTDNRSVRFNIVSGTSMSCPHISGLAALLKSLHKNWSPAAIKSALMTTAYTLDTHHSPITDAAASKFATPFAFGSGHVDPEKASNPGLIYDISANDYLIHLCSLNYNSSQIALFRGKNFSCPNASHLQPGDLNYPSFAILLSGNNANSSSTYTRTLTNVGIPVSNYAVKVSEPEGVSVTVQPRVLNFRKVGEKLSYIVTFMAVTHGAASTNFTFGSLVWVSDKHSVRSPIAVTWL
ncbi:hypothetical protein ACS0TY_019957 [Phlomoides rotata]